MMVFEKTNGLLVQIAPELAERARAGRRFTRLSNVEIDVLWTADEEAARAAEEQAALEATERATEAALLEKQALQQRKAAAMAKLEAIGIGPDEVKALLG